MKSEGLAGLGATLQGRDQGFPTPGLMSSNLEPSESLAQRCKHGRLESGLSGTHLWSRLLKAWRPVFSNQAGSLETPIS